MKFRCVSTHPEPIATGRVLEPGEFVELNKSEQEDPVNTELLARGVLIGVSSKGDNVQQEAAERLLVQQEEAVRPLPQESDQTTPEEVTS